MLGGIAHVNPLSESAKAVMSLLSCCRSSAVVRAASGVAVLAACSSVAPSGALPGDYDLVQYDSKDLPAKVFQLPTRDGQPTNCWYAAASGSLVIDSSTFSYDVVFENTCTGAMLWHSGISGRYEQNGAKITFIVTGGETEILLPGSVTGKQVLINEPAHSLTFRRRGGAA